MTRFITIIGTIVIFLITHIPAFVIEGFRHKSDPVGSDLRQLEMIKKVFSRAINQTGCNVTYIGEDNVPKDQAVLYVANHKSLLDVPLTYSRVPGRTGYVSKIEWKKIPLFSDWMERLHCLFLDRSNIKEGLKMVLEGIEKIKSGISIFIFPEGTRNKTEERMLPFKEGSVKMAEKTGCLIIPVAISGSAEAFERQSPRVVPGDIIVEYGTPIDPKALTKEEKKFLGAYCQKKIEAMLIAHEQMLAK